MSDSMEVAGQSAAESTITDDNGDNSTCPFAIAENESDSASSDAEDELSDLEEMLEKAVDCSKYPEGANVRKKTVLEVRPHDPINVLPNDWIEVTHRSGLPVYLHRKTRVCTFSRPYFIGTGSVRNHLVPLSAVPCLAMKRQLSRDEEPQVQSTPKVEVKTASDPDHLLAADQLNEYAKAVFRFKTIDVVRFAKWSETRNFHRERKRKLFADGGAAPGKILNDVQLITVPSLSEVAKPSQRAFCLNPVNKSSVTILHEYVQKVLKSAVLSATTPYRCVAKLKPSSQLTQIKQQQSIEAKLKLLQEKYERDSHMFNDLVNNKDNQEFLLLGVGFGKSKKTAKMAAAAKVLQGLIPALTFNHDYIAVNSGQADEQDPNAKPADEIFELVDVDDSRIPDLSQRAGQPQPYVVLQEIVKRNATMGDRQLDLQSQKVRHQRHEFTLTLGPDLKVSVVGGNKKDAKQRAAQLMLKKLYPKAQKWADILKLYNDQVFALQKEAHKYKRQLTTGANPAHSPEESMSVDPSEVLGNELRSAISKLGHTNRPPVERPVVDWTGTHLDQEDSRKFVDVCQRYAHLFGDDSLLESIIE